MCRNAETCADWLKFVQYARQLSYGKIWFYEKDCEDLQNSLHEAKLNATQSLVTIQMFAKEFRVTPCR